MEEVIALPVDPETPPAHVEVVSELDVAALPVGVTRLFVELVGDGLGVGVRVPVLVAKGPTPGPTFGITCALHGNELNGIPVVHELFRGLDPAQVRGAIVGVIALNPPGVHRNQREYSDGTDLNRIMPGKKNGTESQVYAHRILDRIVSQFDFLLDLHTASFGRINSLYVRADLKHPVAAALAYLLEAEIIVHNEASAPTLRGAAMRLGIPAVTLEIGNPQLWQERYLRAALNGIRATLNHADVLTHTAELDACPAPILCSSSSWMYTDRGGMLEVKPNLCEFVNEGDIVAAVRTAFGDVIREYQAPAQGVIVGRSVNPVGPTGARILHLGHLASGEHGLLSRGDCFGEL